MELDWYDALVVAGALCICVAGWIVHPSLGLAALGGFLFTAGRKLDPGKAVKK